MEAHDEVCLCFHVTKQKIVNWIRLHRPRRASQISECYGAGTGCGWCRPFLQRYFEAASEAPSSTGASSAGSRSSEPSAAHDRAPTADIDRDEYARLRAEYIRQGKGTPPPGATPT